MRIAVLILKKKVRFTFCEMLQNKTDGVNIKNRLTVEQCKSILESEGEYYTDEQIKSVRELFYLLAELHLQSLTNQKQIQK